MYTTKLSHLNINTQKGLVSRPFARSKSKFGRVFVAVALVLVLVCGGFGWYFLSQRDTVPPGDFIQGDGFYIYRGNSSQKGSTTITVPAMYKGLPVTEIASFAFKNFTKLKVVHLPDTILQIHDNAFYGCISLQGITIPADVAFLPAMTFYNCKSLKEITLLHGDVVAITNITFQGCTSLEAIWVFDTSVQSKYDVLRFNSPPSPWLPYLSPMIIWPIGS